MEEHFSSLSFYICQSIIENTLIDAVFQKAEHLNNMLNFFSCQHSENLSTAMISTSSYFYGKPAKRLTQDFPTQMLQKKSFKLREGRKLDGKRTSIFLTQKKMDRKSLGNFNSQQNQERSDLGLVPLKQEEEQSKFQVKQDELQQKMREIKFHQQYVRSRYAENMRQTIKKNLTFHKMDTISTPKISVYDYDGSLLVPLKVDGHRLPAHYLELQVKVQEDQKRQKVCNSKIKKQEKNKNILKFDNLDIKQNLRPVYSSFFKDISTIEWAEGIEPNSNKEQCRKILGYSNNRHSLKKKVDLFKPSEKPIKIKFEQLENYKTTSKATSLSIIEPNNIKREQNTYIILANQKTHKLVSANKTIQVANKKALQFLIRQDEEALMYKKMNVFSNAKSCHVKTSQKSVTFLKKLDSNINQDLKSPSVVVAQKGRQK